MSGSLFELTVFLERPIKHTCTQTKANSMQFYTNIMRLNKNLSIKAESQAMYKLLICRRLDTADLLLANGNTVTRYRVTQRCALLKKRHTCSPQRVRKVHTHTHKHTQRLLGGNWQGATQWTERTRWHKTSLRWAFYKLEHGRQMEQFTKTRPLGMSGRERSLSSPLSSLCSYWHSEVWCEQMGEIQAESHVIQGLALMGLAGCPVIEVSQVRNWTDTNDRLIME